MQRLQVWVVGWPEVPLRLLGEGRARRLLQEQDLDVQRQLLTPRRWRCHGGTR